MAENNRRNFMEIEDELNAALGRIGEKSDNREDTEHGETTENVVAVMTVQDLLEELKIDEFEKIYITTAAQTNSPNKEPVPEDKLDKVYTLAEYQLSQRDQNAKVDVKEQEELKTASNFYMIPHTVKQRYSVGNMEQTRMVDIYTINDIEGYSLYNIIDGQHITMSTSFRDKIERYMKKYYTPQIISGEIKVEEVIEHFTPRNMNELYHTVANQTNMSMRYLPDRIDDFVQEKGIETRMFRLRGMYYELDNLEEAQKTGLRENPEQKLEKDEKENLKEPDLQKDKVRDGASIKLREDDNKQNEKQESYVEKIARVNHVSPAVVNTRVIENFEKVEEDTGIPLKGRYQRGEVVAVRLPYKFGYRTFLVEKSTGLTIDGKGALDRKPGKLYDFDEIEDYFRFKLRDGHDGGEGGKPLRYDEGRDYTTYIDANGDIKEEKFVNNRKQHDMLRTERERYLMEVEEVDKRLKEAIQEYEKEATHDNYKKVQDLMHEKVNIDNKYNALDEQREITKKTKENVEKVIQRNLDDEDDEWYPSRGRFHR